MAEGTVRWFGGKRPDGKTRGYGFILQDNGEEIFVHYSEIEKDKEGFKTLNEGQRVTFEVGEGQDGKAQAINVHVIDDAEPAPAPDATVAAEAVAAAAIPGALDDTPVEEPVAAIANDDIDDEDDEDDDIDDDAGDVDDDDIDDDDDDDDIDDDDADEDEDEDEDDN